MRCSLGFGAFTGLIIAATVYAGTKSEPIPEQRGPVTIVVGDSYQDIVLDASKDVLLFYYNPTCPPCKRWAPIYDRLGSLFKDHNDTVVIAKVDAIANDVPGDEEFWPQFKLYRANEKSPTVDYGGEQDPRELAAFIRDNGSHHTDVLKGLEQSEPSAPGEAAEGSSDSIDKTASDDEESVSDVNKPVNRDEL